MSNTAQIFPTSTDEDAIDLISKILVYEPNKRLTALAAMTHPYFDELRDEGLVFPNGNLLPDIFNFTDAELMKATPEQKEILIPLWYLKQVEKMG